LNQKRNQFRKNSEELKKKIQEKKNYKKIFELFASGSRLIKNIVLIIELLNIKTTIPWL
jgi:hypothetical protein